MFAADDYGDIDGLGRLRHASEAISYPNQTAVSRTCSYGYDMLSQLTWAMATGVGPYEYVEELFSYKQDGNIDNYECRTKLPGQNPLLNLNTYSYTGDIMAGAAGDNPFALANDNNGNITKLPTTEPNAVNWNWDNKLKNAQKGTSSIAVKYDPMGNRVWRQSTVGGVTTTRKYIIDISGELPTILCEIDTSSGSLKTSYIYADGQILSQRIHDPEDPNYCTPYYYVHDRLGSVRLMIDNEGTAVNSYTYKPYGQFCEGETVETVGNPWKFTGQFFDNEIDQYYLRARQYDPAMMRFTSRDAATGQYASPLTLHKYLYCQNEPVDRMDRLGLWYEWIHRSFGNLGWGYNSRKGFAPFDYARLDFEKPAWRSKEYNKLHFKTKEEASRDVLEAIGDGDVREFEYNMHGWQDTYTHTDRGHTWKHGLGREYDDSDPSNPDDVRAYKECDQTTRFFEGLFLKSNIDFWMTMSDQARLPESNPWLSVFDPAKRDSSRASRYMEPIFRQQMGE